MAVLTKKNVAVLTKWSVAVLVATHLMWPFWPKQCGRFDQSSVAVLVVIQLSVAVLVVAILECGRFDWFPPKVPNRYTVGELRSGVTGFTTIYATGSHRFMPCMLQVRNDERDEFNLRQKKGWIWPITGSCISPLNTIELCRTFRRDVATTKRQIVALDIRTLHDCPSQMNENLLISNSKLTSDSELIWWR